MRDSCLKKYYDRGYKEILSERSLIIIDHNVLKCHLPHLALPTVTEKASAQTELCGLFTNFSALLIPILSFLLQIILGDVLLNHLYYISKQNVLNIFLRIFCIIESSGGMDFWDGLRRKFVRKRYKQNTNDFWGHSV